MKYNEVFKDGLPEWLYRLRESDRMMYDFTLLPTGSYQVTMELNLNNYTKIEAFNQKHKANVKLALGSFIILMQAMVGITAAVLYGNKAGTFLAIDSVLMVIVFLYCFIYKRH